MRMFTPALLINNIFLRMLTFVHACMGVCDKTLTKKNKTYRNYWTLQKLFLKSKEKSLSIASPI